MRNVIAAAAFLVAVFTLPNLQSFAEQEGPRLDISKIDSVKEIEPAIFEIVVSLQDNSRATLRMNGSTLTALGDRINRVGSNKHVNPTRSSPYTRPSPQTDCSTEFLACAFFA
jgi:hypothetical protein